MATSTGGGSRPSSSLPGDGNDIELKPVMRASSTVKDLDTFDNAFHYRDDSDVSHSGSGVLKLSRWDLPARTRGLHGWRFAVACCAFAVSVVLVLNLSLTAWAASHFRDSLQGSVGTAFVGQCAAVDRWSFWLHIAINAISAIMLGASNYTMQCLNAPTREEVDRAHTDRAWLDIGIPSVRNMSRIRWPRVLLWCLIALSSVPIHLLYNSAVFKTIEANDYTWAIINEDFFSGQPFYEYMYQAEYSGEPISFDDVSLGGLLRNLQTEAATTKSWQDPSIYERLDNKACIAAYGTSYVNGRKNVFLVTDKRTDIANQTVFDAMPVYVPTLYTTDLVYSWVCTGAQHSTKSCDIGRQQRESEAWTVWDLKIEYCLSELTPGHCKLQFSVAILVAVTLMNAVKAVSMLLTLFLDSETRLLTTGDALASFLVRPDASTEGRCLMSKSDVTTGPLRWTGGSKRYQPVSQPSPVVCDKPVRRRWLTVVSIKRWIGTLASISIALAVAIVFLVIGVNFVQGHLDDGDSPFSLGFGALDSRAIIVSELPQSGTRALVASVLLANLPQLVCSVLYFAYNALLTCMCLCNEYSQYGLHDQHKALRVSQPEGKQRSTYSLHLPYRYSIPLIVMSALLHWVISQSIFLVRISVLQDDDTAGRSNLGYSPSAMLCTIVLGASLPLLALALGSRKLASPMPMAGSCSAALSAACHPPRDDVNAAHSLVQWGALANSHSQDVGHCCFTSESVDEPVPGRLYGRRSPAKD